jgi:hypothetical protein
MGEMNVAEQRYEAVLAVNHNRIAARRLDDDASAAFTGGYLTEHITYGYAVTADTTHAALGENTTRARAYVAMTHGRESNTANLYERTAGEAHDQHREREDVLVARRGSAAALLTCCVTSSLTSIAPAPRTKSVPTPRANIVPSHQFAHRLSRQKQLNAGAGIN